jgi:hypothetical protein
VAHPHRRRRPRHQAPAPCRTLGQRGKGRGHHDRPPRCPRATTACHGPVH